MSVPEPSIEELVARPDFLEPVLRIYHANPGRVLFAINVSMAPGMAQRALAVIFAELSREVRR